MPEENTAPRPPIPENETERLAALLAYDILDTEPEDAFDSLVQLASMICDTPMGAVSLIDAERQWFKSRVGIDACETSRDVAFCAHAILDDDVLMVEDATRDPRFARNPLVTGDFHLRFYAGVPLINADGYALGTLCLLDKMPRQLTEQQVEALRTLGRAVMAQLDLRQRVRELQERERELAEARDLAVEASRLKSQFLAGMSHELRTPLNSIIGFSELLLDRIPGSLNDEQESCVADIHESGRQLLALINDLLDLSKIEANRMKLDVEELILDPILQAAVHAMHPLADQGGLEISLEAPAEPLVVRADPGRVRQVLNNLLSNAVKFTERGGSLTVRARRDGCRIEVDVEDTGIGLQAEELEAIFDEFHQADGSRRQQEGTGLGLALCRRLLALMDGEIRVESTPGKGSVFTFTLPAVELDAPTLS